MRGIHYYCFLLCYVRGGVIYLDSIFFRRPDHDGGVVSEGCEGGGAKAVEVSV